MVGCAWYVPPERSSTTAGMTPIQLASIYTRLCVHPSHLVIRGTDHNAYTHCSHSWSSVPSWSHCHLSTKASPLLSLQWTFAPQYNYRCQYVFVIKYSWKCGTNTYTGADPSKARQLLVTSKLEELAWPSVNDSAGMDTSVFAKTSTLGKRAQSISSQRTY